MKKILASAFLAAFALTANVQADQKSGDFASEEKAKGVVYSVGMTGVTWNGCKASVREAFTKLAGVSSIEIEPGEDPGTQKVTVVSTSADLTKEQAVASLGDKATRFVVQTWKKADE